MKILIICTGNTCRSPMGEGIFQYMINNHNLNIDIKSAGISAFDGDNVSRQAISALQNIGIDISQHKSSIVNDKLVEEADLILTMTNSHKDILIRKFPTEKDKIYLLNEYAFGMNKDVEDPFGGSLRDYEIARDEIFMAIEKIVQGLVNS